VRPGQEKEGKDGRKIRPLGMGEGEMSRKTYNQDKRDETQLCVMSGLCLLIDF
jgi:hypothetical protein